jgi:hypothetical protein
LWWLGDVEYMRPRQWQSRRRCVSMVSGIEGSNFIGARCPTRDRACSLLVVKC